MSTLTGYLGVVVDLQHVGQHWESEEAQLAFADVLVLNKVDLVSAIKPMARRPTSHNAEVPMQELMGVPAFELERALSLLALSGGTQHGCGDPDQQAGEQKASGSHVVLPDRLNGRCGLASQ